ncbi:MAG: glycosyltransferase [Beijerinckiaceae bacterium]|nr:MAG: glycosyltransferase [Beijerinckiaceae bacterium]
MEGRTLNVAPTSGSIARPARALMISPILPMRSSNGLAMRMALFAEALEVEYQLDLIVIPVAGRLTGGAAVSESTSVSIWEAESETHFRLLSQIADDEERLAAFRRYGKPSMSSALSQPVLNRIAKIVAANRYDLVHIGRSYMLPAIDAIDDDVPISVDLDEDDYISTMSMADAAMRCSAAGQAARLVAEAEAYDHLIAARRERLRLCFVSNEPARRTLKVRHATFEIAVSPNAVAIPERIRKRDDGCTLGFIGALGYWPNVEAIYWFVEKVLPRIHARSSLRPRLHVAGPDAPESLLRRARRPGVDILGAVPDLCDFYRNITVAIAPIRLGGPALRTKLIEAGAHSTAFITTSVSASGMRATSSPCGWIAKDAAAFSDACIEALENSAERRRREQQGRHAALMFYDRRRTVSALGAQMAAIGRRSPPI